MIRLRIDQNQKTQTSSLKMILKMLAVSLLFTLATAIILAGIFLEGNTVDNLLYYARVPLADGSSQAITNCVRFCLPVAIGVFVTINVLSLLIILTRKKVCHLCRKLKKPYPNIVFKAIYDKAFLISSIMLICSLIVFLSQVDAFSYLKGKARKTKVYEQYYVSPGQEEFIFPEKKKNLIYIFLESMETSYASVAEGGMMEDNYIPYLTELTKDKNSVSFSDTEVLGGAYPITGTTWTAAAMISQTSGIPLTMPVTSSGFGPNGEFLPGAYSIGQVLENAGYNQMLMVGSKASFAKRKDYFEQHGNYEIFDYYTAIEEGKIPEDYYVWWGYEDAKLFEYAKENIRELSEKDEPFNFTMLTVDTHFSNGYRCSQCERKFNTKYANVINCSDHQVHDFIEWLKQEPYYEDTVVVICGDHLTMQHAYFETVPEDVFERGRRVYNCIINSGLSTEHTKNRLFTTMDMYPTTLAALGVKWSNNTLGLGVNLFSGEKTLCERFGIDGFIYHLASSSDFYHDFLIDGNTSIESEVGIDADRRMSDHIEKMHNSGADDETIEFETPENVTE